MYYKIKILLFFAFLVCLLHLLILLHNSKDMQLIQKAVLIVKEIQGQLEKSSFTKIKFIY